MRTKAILIIAAGLLGGCQAQPAAEPLGAVAAEPKPPVVVVMGETCNCCSGAAGEAMAKLVQQLYDRKDFGPLRTMAAGKIMHAELALAAAYYRGHGVERDLEESNRWLTRAANKTGATAAQYALGQSYEQGEGVPADAAEAVRWYTKAAIGGEVRAKLALGRCYRDGSGVEADHARARQWFASASQGENCEVAQEAREALTAMK